MAGFFCMIIDGAINSSFVNQPIILNKVKMKTANGFKTLIIILAMLISIPGIAQLITTDPPFPTTMDLVLIIFDATEGSGGLAGYTGDVYAHTGVITSESSTGSDWRYVQTSWGQNTPETKMERIGDDLYTLEISPDVREYYGVPFNEEIYQMAFVFRSDFPVQGSYLEGKTATGGDIFVDVFEAGLTVAFFKPDYKPVIITPGDTIEVEIKANNSDSLSLYVDNELIKTVEGELLTDTLTGNIYGKHWVRAEAKNDTSMIADSFYYYVRKPVEISVLPEGIRDGINYIDENTVILSLFAPYKDYIYVIGDFNDWMVDSGYYMKLTPDSNRYWLQIDDLVPSKEYIFQYFIDGYIRVGDSYADKTSDPDHDKYISNETYPNLIEYPEGKTTAVATVLQTNQEEYQWQINNFEPPEITDLVIYELLIRDFTTQHTYQALTDTLGYLERLGVNAIELMPVNEFEGNISWGYNPSYYFAPDKYYGPKNMLKQFIDECHSRGIAVIIDIVLNHAYDQCPMVQMYFNGSKPTPENPWFNVNSNFTNPDAHWGNDFNHESIYTQQLTDSINSYWMSEYHVNGFRFDFTKGFGNNIKGPDDPWGSNYDADRIALLKRMADEIWERNPEAIVIIEHLSENSEEKELANYGMLLWGNMNHNYAEASMSYHTGGKSDFSWISYQKRGWNDPHVVGYMESHDEERIMYKNVTWGNSGGTYNIKDTTTALRRIELISTFFYTIPGPKMIWQFGEIGYDYSIDFNGRLGPKPVRWDYLQDWRRSYLYRVVSSLIGLRTNYDVFETNNFELHVSGITKQIILRHNTMDIVIVGNFDISEGEIIPLFTHTGSWYDYFTGEEISVSNLNTEMQLDPGEYHIFSDIQLPTPDIGTTIELPVIINNQEASFMVFPNPVRDVINIRLELSGDSDISLSVYNCYGQKLINIYNGHMKMGIHNFSWSKSEKNGNILKPGLYFCVLRTENRTESQKFLVY